MKRRDRTAKEQHQRKGKEGAAVTDDSFRFTREVQHTIHLEVVVMMMMMLVKMMMSKLMIIMVQCS